MARPTARYAIGHLNDRLPWPVCVPVIIGLSLTSWIAVVLAFRAVF